VESPKSKGPATAQPVNEPQEIEIARRHLGLTDNIFRLRLQQLSARLHALGPKPLFHFLDEVERGAPLREHLERYAELTPLADFIKANGGDQFGPAAFLVRGGEK
jgi:hypothetical protein